MPFSGRPLRTLLLSLPLGLGGQSLDARMAQADKLYAARDAAGAFALYEAVVKERQDDYEALWKAARTATDLGEFEASKPLRESYFSRAQLYGERAMKANAADAEGHFQLARAIGRVALAAGVKERVRLAGEVRTHALDALAHNAQHGGAMDVMGMWNAEIMRLSGIERVFAKTFLGGKVMSEANWDAAEHYLEESVAQEPDRIVHHLDLAGVYRDVGKRDRARAQYEWIARAQAAEFNDANYKKQAADALRGLK
jgi:tetratricopeptide (TPR) repeat protein